MPKQITQVVYLVMIRVQPGDAGGANTEVYSAKLTRKKAEVLSEVIPGSWVKKIVADKL